MDMSESPAMIQEVEEVENHNHSPSVSNHNHSPSVSNHNHNNEAPVEGFSNMNLDLDKVLKAIFFGAIFYLLSQPELYKMTKKSLGKIDGVLVHSVVFAVLYWVLNMFI